MLTRLRISWPMKTFLRRVLALISLLTPLFVSPALRAQDGDTDWNVALLDRILAGVPPGGTLAQIGDMEYPVAALQTWRDQLATGVTPLFTIGSGVNFWPGGNVYYTFTNGISPVKQKAFTDAAAEWTLCANIHFIPWTGQANYVIVMENPALQGGLAVVGMVGGEQWIQIGTNAWNRHTLTHEVGHTLGLVHEHQRSDRDSYLTVNSNNIESGEEFNFVLLPTATNRSPYDFLSIMHYAHNAFSSAPDTLDTMVPLPAYSNYYSQMGHGDPVLSAYDRSNMAAIYGATLALTNIVTNSQDNSAGSLRAALYYGFDNPGATIRFNLATNDPGYTNGVFTIELSDQLSSLYNGTVIDGTTEPAQFNTNGPAIQINGALASQLAPPANGLHFAGTNSAARGLIINGFPQSAVLMDNPNAVSNTVSGCYLGVDPTGALAVTNYLYPVLIQGGARGNVIGGTTAAARNVISGSSDQGVLISDPGTIANVIEGNYIGLNATGTAPLMNGFEGVGIYGGAQSNIIGGTAPGAGNVISGNSAQGVVISDEGTTGNVVEGNYIGLDPTGNVAISNANAGVHLGNGAQGNIVGGTAPGARNVISGNGQEGVLLRDDGTAFNLVEGNYVGLSAAGTNAIPNVESGVQLYVGPAYNVVGGTTSAARNIVSGNGQIGVLISFADTESNVVEGNYIGLNPAGTAAIPNGEAGVQLYSGPQNNLIGGTAPGAGNVISGNLQDGVSLLYAGTTGNSVQGNIIGLNAAGSMPLGNQQSGVDLYSGAQNNLIGGTAAGAGNVISGNSQDGVAVLFAGTTGNLIEGNLIGLNAAGTAALGNNWSGVEFYTGPQSNTLGGFGTARNFISGNGIYGVSINNPGTAANLVLGNTIGLDGTNNLAVPNVQGGIEIFSGTVGNVIGGLAPGSANLIAGNADFGVFVSDLTTSNNTVRGNSIFANSSVGQFGIVVQNNGNNNLVNPPSISSAVVGASNTTVIGSLSGFPASTTFHLDFYADTGTTNTAQARDYLGTKDVTTSGGGSAAFTNLLALLPMGRNITATATDPSCNTSNESYNGTVVTGVSSVGDGIPDVWRAAHFGGSGTTTNSTNCATCDADHDGMNNLGEFLAGTNPTNAASVLKGGTLAKSGADVVLSFQSVAGVVYRVYERADVAPGNWAILADQILGTGGTIQLTDPGAASLPRRFYKLQVLP